MPQARDRTLHVCLAQHRIFLAGVQLDGVIGWVAGRSAEAAYVSDVQLLRLPGLQSFSDLLRKTIRVGRRTKRLFRQYRRRLVVPVPIALRSREARNQHIDRKSTRLNSSHLGISYAVF